MMLTAASAQQEVDWTGLWATKWRGGGAQVVLKQNGPEVTGTYALYNGRIEAHVDGQQLIGKWFEGTREGEFVFVMAPDGATFMGRYESATSEWWTGARVNDEAYQGIRVEQTSPMTTMRSFLQAMNQSGADGVSRNAGGGMALVGMAAGLIDVTSDDRGGLNMPDYTRLLFDVIDKTTFRLWSLPHDAVAGTEVTVKLPQYDSDVALDLGFRRTKDDWFIVGPPTAALRAKLAEFQAKRGEMPDAVNDPANLRTPRDTFKMLLGGIIDMDDDPQHSTLDMRDYNAAVRTDEAALLARYMKKVIDRIGYVYWQEIPDDPKSMTPYVFFEHPSGNITVGPVSTDKGIVWQFTPETLGNIRTLYADVEDMPVAPEFAAFASDDPYFETRSLARSISPALLARTGAIELWQWILLGLALVLGLVFGFIANAIISLFMRLRARHSRREPYYRLVAWSVRSIFLGLFLLVALRPLGLPEIVAAPVKALAWSAIVIGAVPVVWHLIGRLGQHYSSNWTTPGYHETLISLMTGVARVAVVVIAFLLLAEVLAIPYQGVIAGLGIGGLAVALAAQPTLQNFLSGLTLYADRPVSVGDFCRFGGHSGTVEHIGMRSTRIRSSDRTIISVPNSDFAGMLLENFARRDRIRFTTKLQLRAETTTDQLRYVLADLRKLLIAHPRVVDEPCRVRFIGFGDYSLDLEIFTYIQTADSAEFLAIQEDIYLRVMSVLEAAGVQLAFPTQLGYQTSDLPIDEAKRAAAESTVEAWRAAENLPFPDFTKAEKAAFGNTLSYPPEGSSQTDTAVQEVQDRADSVQRSAAWRMPWKAKT